MTTNAEFENCLDACKVGKFHKYLMFIAFLSHVATTATMSNTAFISPSAACDLHLDIMARGWLQSMPFFGMVASGIFAGFVTDTFGRRKALVVCSLGVFLTIFVESFSQTSIMLSCCKFIEGFLTNGAQSANIAMVSEFYSRKIRDRIMLVLASFVAVSYIIIALMAWATLPLSVKFVLFDGALVLKTWNLFIAACSLWSLAAGILYYLFPESPKYLFTHGRHDEAIVILKKIYLANTGNLPNNAACTEIYIEDHEKRAPKTKFREQLHRGLIDLKPLFRLPLAKYAILIIIFQFMLTLSHNTLRMWYPSISSIMESNEWKNNKTRGRMCNIIDAYMVDLKYAVDKDIRGPCVPLKLGSQTYLNAIVLGIFCLILYMIGGILIPRTGKKNLLYSLLVGCFASIVGLHWATMLWQVAGLFSFFIALTQLAINLIQILVVSLFPTTLRTLALTMAMMSGRIGSLSGNIMFPILLARGCMVPFFVIGVLLLSNIILVYFLPAKGSY